ncbi:transporter substrate-binding domain-containing protein [bacterium]|nr:transporter substrate-binding domain-containing protein [bacterium]
MRDGRKISKKPVSILLFLCVLVLIPANIVRPQEKPLPAAIEVMAPCVMKSADAYTGFEIELWEEISKDLGLEFAYYETSMDRIFKDLIEGKAQVGFSCITITHEREQLVDFSHHTLDSGLRIMVLNKKAFSLIEPVKTLFSPLVMKAMAYLCLFIIVCGHVFWWVERGHKYINAKYFPGIFQAYWYVMVTMTTVGYGDIVPRKWVGRVMAFLVMLIGIGFFGWAVAQLSSAITLQKLHSDITDEKDLRNKIVATVEGTTSVEALDDLGAIVVPVKVIDNAIEKLLQRKVDAVVFDSPTILYYAHNDETGKVAVVGNLFDQQYYGFLFPQGSELREPVNRAILKMHKTGQYDKIFNKWFGSY